MGIKRAIVLGMYWLMVCCTGAHASNTIYLATTEWPPYVSKELPHMGLIYAIVTQAYQQQGYQTRVEFLPWTEAKTLHKYSNDAFFPAYSDDKDDALACSDPIHGGPVGFYQRKNSLIRYTVKNPPEDQENALRGLKHYKIGVVSGYTNTQALDEATFLTKLTAKNDYENLKQLQDHKTDLAFSDVFVAEYFIDEKAPTLDNITFMGPALANKNLYVCFSKRDRNYPRKLAALNQGLKALKQNGEMQRLMDEYSF